MSCGNFGRGAAEARGFDGVAHEHGDGHGADATGDGCERAGGVDGVGMDVADEGAAFGAELFKAIWEVVKEALGFTGVGDAVGADINDGGVGLDPIGFHVGGFAYGGDDDIGAAEDIGEVTRFGMANRDGGVGVHKEKSHGFANDIAAAEDGGVGAFDLDFVAAQDFHAAGGVAGDQAGTSANEAAEVDGMEAVHIFGGIDGFEDALGIHLRGKRELDQDTVDVVVAIQIFDDGEHFESAYRGSRGDESTGKADLFAGGDFAFHVELRGGIFADEDGGEAGTNAGGGEEADFIF